MNPSPILVNVLLFAGIVAFLAFALLILPWIVGSVPLAGFLIAGAITIALLRHTGTRR